MPIEHVDILREVLTNVRFTRETFDQMRWLLWKLDQRLVGGLRLDRISLKELRQWLLFAILRALSLTVNRAAGKPDQLTSALTANEMSMHLANQDRFGWEPCFRLNGVDVASTGGQSRMDRLEDVEHEATFHETIPLYMAHGRLKLHISLCAFVNED